MVLQYLQNTGTVYENVKLDCFVIMPNHIHCIITLQNGLSSAGSGSPWAATPTTTIPKNENELQRIRQYIQNNPANWQEDKYFI